MAAEENRQNAPAEGAQDLTLEETFTRLEEITGKLENPDTPLEDSFALYEEGTRLLKAASAKIDRVEKKVLVLSEDGETHEL